MRVHWSSVWGVVPLRGSMHRDERGAFTKLFSWDWPALGEFRVMQVNRSVSKAKGTVRGLHVQTPPGEERKVVACTKGRVFDVILDLRRESTTFGKWTSLNLDSEYADAVCVPVGCAHGFQTLTDDVELIYLHTNTHQPSVDGGLSPLSSEVGIRWPIPVSRISDRDRALPLSVDQFREVTWTASPANQPR